MAHILMDFETGGLNLHGKILNVAYCAFEIDTVNTIDELVERTTFSKFDAGLPDQDLWQYEKASMSWWANQSSEAKDKAFGSTDDDISTLEFADDFINFCQSNLTSNDCVWFRGPSFDATIIDRIYEVAGKDAPYAFWKIRDVRSFVDVANIVSGEGYREFSGKFNGYSQSYIAHDPVHDVAKDIQQVQAVYNLLKGNL